MESLKMSDLENCFKEAMDNSAAYVAVKIEMEGFPEDEVIINPINNAEEKLNYYKKTYDENLNHKHSKGIKITGFAYARYGFDEIEEDFM